MEAFLFIGAALSIIGVIFYLSWLSEKKRREAMQALAQRLDCTFHQDGVGFENELKDYFLFSQGRQRSASNVILSEKESFNVAIFDYRYTTGSGKNKSTHSQTVIRVRSSNLELPHFEIRPEHFFHKIGAVFGYQDIDFDSYPKFSKQFLLRGENEEAIRHTFTEDVIRYFENFTALCAEGRGDTLLVYRQGKRSKIDNIETEVKDAMQLLAVFVSAQSANTSSNS